MAMQNTASLAKIFRTFADLIKQEMNVGSDVVEVTLDSPKIAEPEVSSSVQRLNLFFYRFEPFGFNADVNPGETWLLRAHCLVTPFTAVGGTKIGENDLYLLGEAMRVLHETPVRSMMVEDDGRKVEFHFQAVFEPLSIESINQIWSTQGDVAYRPSVSYEIALAPIIPAKKAVGAPMVGATSYRVDGNIFRSGENPDGADDPGINQSPVAGRVSVDTSRSDWAPAICFVYEDACVQTLSFVLGSSALEAFKCNVWVAGEAGAEVTFHWEVWTGDTGWTALDPVSVPGSMIGSAELDPDSIDLTALASVSAPADVLLRSGQAALHVERVYRRIPEEPERIARSNVLLLNLYEA